jgi:hypothetical protein
MIFATITAKARPAMTTTRHPTSNVFPRLATAVVGSAVAFCVLATGACSKAAIDVPDEVSTGFDVQKDGFSFENYGGVSSYSSFGTDELIRMFGQQAVCIGGTLPCTAKPGAFAWARSVDQAMNSGRCEGFAVLSQLFFTRALKPADFGADTTFDLQVGANAKLGNELAYWFGSQLAKNVLAGKVRKYNARDVMPFLAEILTPGAAEAYRIGIVNKQGNRVYGGHALTPIGYKKIGDGRFELRVYDNNIPGEERKLLIDVNANNWSYQGGLSPSDASSLFFGDDTNRNPLYFAPVKARVGKFACKFCEKGGSGQLVASSTGTITVSDKSGNSVQLKDGEATAQGGASVDTAFNFMIAPLPVLSAEMPSGDGDFAVSVDGSQGAISISASDRSASLHVLSARVQPAVNAGDGDAGGEGTRAIPHVELTLDSAGVKVSGDANAQSEVGMSRTITGDDGSQKTVEVTITSPDGSSVQTNVEPSGKITTQVSGGSGDVVVKITQKSGDTQSTATFTAEVGSTGSGTTTINNTVPSDPNAAIEGTSTNGNGETKPLVNMCANGIKDASEADVDCGGACGACRIGNKCVKAADCQSEQCSAAGQCVASACADGRKNNDESDIDCGGTCPTKCVNNKGCTLAADCVNNSCDEGQCFAMPDGAQTRYSAMNAASLTVAGANVNAWADLSGNGLNLSPSGGALPVLVPAAINGHAAVQFAASRMQTKAFAKASEVTVFVASQYRAGQGQWGQLVGHGDRDNDWSIEQAFKAGPDIMHFQTANDNVSTELTFTPARNYIIVARMTGTGVGATRYFSQFSKEGGFASTTGTNNTIGVGPDVLRVGGSSQSEYGAHYVGEIVYYTRSLSDVERDEVASHLQYVWGME